jgi:hypothetical protein
MAGMRDWALQPIPEVTYLDAKIRRQQAPQSTPDSGLPVLTRTGHDEDAAAQT